MLRIFLIISSMFLMSPLHAQQETTQPSTEPSTAITTYLSSFSYSNIVPVAQLFNDHWRQTPKQSATTAFSQNELGLRYQHNNYSLSLVKRIDMSISTTPQTAAFYYTQKYQDNPQNNQQTPLFAQLLQQQSIGMLVGYTWQYEGVSTTFELGYWRIDKMRETVVQGDATLVNGQYSGQLSMQESYSANNLLKRPNNGDFNSSGKGINANIDVTWRATDKLRFALAINDLYSRYNIDNLGYSEGRANTNNSFINDRGYKSFLPIYKGIETSKSHQLSLKPNSKLDITYRGQQGDYLASASQRFNTEFYQLGFRYPLEQAQLSILVDVERFTPTLRLINDQWEIELAMDKLDIHQSMELNFAISYRW